MKTTHKRAAPKGITKKPYKKRTNIPASLITRKAEIKTVDVVNNAVLLSTTTTFTYLNGVIQGAGLNNRIGLKIMMRSLHLTGFISVTGNGAGVAEYMRIIVIYDRQPNGAFPVLADVLQDETGLGGTTNDSTCGLNMSNSERFRIIRDIRMTVPFNSAAAVGDANVNAVIDYNDERRNVNEFAKLVNLTSHYKGNGGTITDCATGSLFLMTIGNVAAANAGYNFNWRTRMRYHDL